MELSEILEKYTNENGFQFGIENVIQSLCPSSIYTISSQGGKFEIIYWDDRNPSAKPSSQEIRDEYIRHRTINEFIDYLKNKDMQCHIMQKY
jgi:hypothetical protein